MSDQLREDMALAKQTAEELCVTYNKFLASRHSLGPRQRESEEKRFRAAFDAVSKDIEHAATEIAKNGIVFDPNDDGVDYVS